MNGSYPVRARLARRYSRRWLLRSGLAVGSATLALACAGRREQAKTVPTSPSPAAPATAAGAVTPRRGGRFLGYVDLTVTSHNPIIDYGQTQLHPSHVYDRLVNYRFGMDTAKEYILEAAQSVEMPEPTTVIFKLKPNLRYHDRPPVNGRAVSAEDIVKVQIYVRDNPRATNSTFQRGSMQSVEAPDDQTVVFKLQAPNAYLFSGFQLGHALVQCIIPRELLDNLETAWPIGSGPYELADYSLNVRYLYRRFPGYRGAGEGLPYTDEREIRALPDPAAQEAAFRSEQIHVWNVPATLVDQIKRDLAGRVEVHEYLAPLAFSISANATKPPWNDVRMREALYRFVDKQQYLNLLHGGRGQVAPGVLTPAFTEYLLDPKQTEKYFRNDLRAARQLIEAAGFDLSREVEIGSYERPAERQGLEIFQQQASKVGLKVRTITMPLGEWNQQKIATGNWEITYGTGAAYDSPQVPLRFHHTVTNSLNRYSGLKDPEVDRMIERAEQTLDRQERVKLIKDIQIALLEKYTPIIVTHSPMQYVAVWKYVRDYEISPVSLAMYQTRMWLDK